MATKVAIPSLEALVRLTFLQKAKGLPLSLFCFQKYCVFIALTQSDELYIPAGGTIKLDDFKFVPSKDIQYYLIASSLPFDSNHLQNLFNHNVSPIIFDKTDLVVVEKIKLH